MFDQASGWSIAFIVAVGLVTYVYAGFYLFKMPDPSTQYGISMNAMMAGLLSIGVVLSACIVVSIFETAGYLIVGVVFPPIIYRVVRKITAL